MTVVFIFSIQRKQLNVYLRFISRFSFWFGVVKENSCCGLSKEEDNFVTRERKGKRTDRHTDTQTHRYTDRQMAGSLCLI